MYVQIKTRTHSRQAITQSTEKTHILNVFMVTLTDPISAKMNTIIFWNDSQPGIEEDYWESYFYTNKDKWVCEFPMPELPFLIY